MSHKVAKAARRAVRALGHNPRDTEVVPRTPIALVDLFGVSRGTFLGQRNLKPGCGRSAFKGAKKLLQADRAAFP
jgi:hypothetical protein